MVRLALASALLALVLAPSAGAATVVLDSGGHASLEGSVPSKLTRLVAAANRIATKPYKYGGGHAKWTDSGYDCSGSTSYVLHAVGLLASPLTSGAFKKYGRPGPGRFVTVYASKGWVLLEIAGMRFDVGGLDEVGSRWWDWPAPRKGFTVRHPPGL